MLNAISVDVEEYFHATNLDPYIGRDKWDYAPSRAEESIRKTLEIFSNTDTKGTFFILGQLAERHPHLVKEIAKAGHEIGSHGFDHYLAYDQTPEKFLSDVTRSKKLLEDISSQEVLGYRAPNFSITDRNQWAYDSLLEAGYKYDSSVYPVWHPRYSNTDKSRAITTITRENGSLLCMPLAAGELVLPGKTIRLPVAGGAYWRLFPRFFLRWGLNRINRCDKLPFCCYFHPWEVDSGQPRIEEMPWLTKIRHYGGIKTLDKRLEFFMRTFKFGTIQDVLKAQLEANNINKAPL
jgi:polysaccharide deacetylase family protein (PEP-CTERM system associated)